MSQYARVPGGEDNNSFLGGDSPRTSTTGRHDDSSAVVFDIEAADGPSTQHQQPRLQRAAAVADRARFAVGRFAQLVGMRIPSARYTSIGERRTLPRRVGGGTIEDGVFSNLNAKPDQSRANRDPNDRGDDDDLADDTLPPNYETAAADCAPPYWETGMFPGPHPLVADAQSWTPESENAGPVPSLVIDELPIGSIIGFIWNMLISSLFQFVGFLVTFFLYSTHAAKLGSRAGLGATLIQFSMYLFKRIAKAQNSVDDPDQKKDNPPPTPHQFKRARIVCTCVLIVGAILLVHSAWRFYRLYSYGLRLAKERQPANAENTDETTANAPPVGFAQSSDMVTSMNRSFGRLRDILLAEIGMPIDHIPDLPAEPAHIVPIQHLMMADPNMRRQFATIFESDEPVLFRRF
ncbi:hypothetical protein MCUN1_000012 [Malassezia cuniculi]|uniref:Metal homeostatis protein bsd2 n=1 Tax=Malassezia cuniculi TaxID=948313 RepID=A0AAF0EQ59_9BASI|nr:hypothetical protein MCUN1_000012 [Malassezia cuniculi]